MSTSITTLVGGVIYSVNRRAVLEVLPPGLKKLWKDWDLRISVLISLVLQILLTILGNRRKCNGKVWIRVLVWSAYTAADSVTIFALGIISNKLSDELNGKGSSSDPSLELTTLWTQFLFLHLGGPDSITAYALQDNDLWMRQLFGLVSQTCGAVYIFLLAFTGRNIGLSILSLSVFVAGFIKYGERIWTLKTASEQLQRNSLLKSLASKQTVSGTPNVEADYSKEETKLLAAYGLLDGTRSLFVDASLSSEQSRYMRHTTRKLSAESAFHITEIQLGMMYDLLYSKGLLVFSKKGIALRVITFSISCFSVVFFFGFIDHRHSYSKIDNLITYALLIVSVFLEIYSALVSLSSDWFSVWLAKKGIKISNLETLYSFLPFRIPRWSKRVAQYTLIKKLYKSKPVLLCLSFLGTEKYNQWNIHLDRDLKKMIFVYLKKAHNELRRLDTINRMPFSTLPKRDSEEERLDEIEDHLSAETIAVAEAQLNYKTRFEYKIVIWGIATEVLYCLRQEEDVPAKLIYKPKAVKRIARYMMYLLAKQPSMLAAQTDKMNPSFEEITKASFFKGVKEDVQVSSDSCHLIRRRTKANFCEKLISRFAKKQRICLMEDIVIYKAMKIVVNKKDKLNESQMWEELGKFWLEMLCFSANRCPVNVHAQKLRYGAELLSHVWLLMAYFGLTHHHFQSPTVGGFKFMTDENKPQYIATEQSRGFRFVDNKIRKDIHQHFHSDGNLLHCSSWVEKIGLSEVSRDFGLLLFRTLARKHSVKVDYINRKQFQQFWDDITDEDFDNRLRLFINMIDEDSDGKISRSDLGKIIRVSGQANRFLKIEENADVYAVYIMDRFRQAGGCIKVEDLQNLLQNVPGRIEKVHIEEREEEEESNLLRRWYKHVESFLVNGFRKTWILMLWFSIVSGLFTYKFMLFQNDMGNCISIAKGAAETLKFNMVLMLLLYCNKTISWLQNKTNLLGAVVYSFNDNNSKFHLVISIGVATGVILHAVTYLSCGFPKLIHATMEQYEPMKPYFGKKQPENYGWFLKGVEGVTGIMMSVVFVLVVCMSTLKRQNTIKHYVSFSLRVTLHFLLIIHGLYRFQNWYKTTLWVYLAIPTIFYSCEWFIRVSNHSKTVRILKIEVDAGNNLLMEVTKPPRFKFEIGQYMLFSIPEISPFEWGLLYIVPVAEDDLLKFQIPHTNDWFSKIGTACRDQTRRISSMRMEIDGPYGVPSQEYKKYDVVLLIGEKSGVVSMMSIARNILDNMHEYQNSSGIESGNNNKNTSSELRTKKAYLHWATDGQQFQTMKQLMEQVSESDENGIIEFHHYRRSIYEGDARSAIIWLLQSIIHDKTGVDVVSDTPIKSHFGEPNWYYVFETIAGSHSDTKIGIFYNGPTITGDKLKKIAREVSENTAFHFDFHSETFKQEEYENDGGDNFDMWERLVVLWEPFVGFIQYWWEEIISDPLDSLLQYLYVARMRIRYRGVLRDDKDDFYNTNLYNLV